MKEKYYSKYFRPKKTLSLKKRDLLKKSKPVLNLQEIETLREIAKEKMEVFQEAEQFLNNQLANNKELEDNISELEKKVTMAKGEQRQLSEAIDNYETEVKSIQFSKYC